jgi:hypothetical protein
VNYYYNPSLHILDKVMPLPSSKFPSQRRLVMFSYFNLSIYITPPFFGHLSSLILSARESRSYGDHNIDTGWLYSVTRPMGIMEIRLQHANMWRFRQRQWRLWFKARRLWILPNWRIVKLKIQTLQLNKIVCWSTDALIQNFRELVLSNCYSASWFAYMFLE